MKQHGQLNISSNTDLVYCGSTRAVPSWRASSSMAPPAVLAARVSPARGSTVTKVWVTGSYTWTGLGA